MYECHSKREILILVLPYHRNAKELLVLPLNV